ncbi:hypothetical protein THAR02_11153 [Trichoderma harzianum]|uniref:Uncharacterized protein n=1 Tax=Trichoderma harzianum TaxID=5544 RepID=A0A0F9WW86_TRIHA|nr:hypothetical protein THAR02_11153 [Trichoderma harzianum]
MGDVRGGVNLTQDTINTLCEVIFSSQTQLLNGNPVDGVEILHRGVFALPCAPDLVFKISNAPKVDLANRWKNAMRAAEISKEHKPDKFDLIVLPRLTLYTLVSDYILNGQRGEYYLIAEQRLSLSTNPLVHKQLYESLGARLEPALQQLVAFIHATGFCDVDFRHIPILDKELTPKTIPKIGLVDISRCGDVQGEAAQQIYHEAFFGTGPTPRGLFRCIAPEQFELLRAEVSKVSRPQITLDLADYYEVWKDRCHDFEEAHRINNEYL